MSAVGWFQTYVVTIGSPFFLQAIKSRLVVGLGWKVGQDGFLPAFADRGDVKGNQLVIEVCIWQG